MDADREHQSGQNPEIRRHQVSLATKFRPAELLADVQAADWGEIIEKSGLTRSQIAAAATMSISTASIYLHAFVVEVWYEP